MLLLRRGRGLLRRCGCRLVGRRLLRCRGCCRVLQLLLVELRQLGLHLLRVGSCLSLLRCQQLLLLHARGQRGRQAARRAGRAPLCGPQVRCRCQLRRLQSHGGLQAGHAALCRRQRHLVGHAGHHPCESQAEDALCQWNSAPFAF